MTKSPLSNRCCSGKQRSGSKPSTTNKRCACSKLSGRRQHDSPHDQLRRAVERLCGAGDRMGSAQSAGAGEMNFGFTNDDAKIAAARQFRDAAVADGWSIAPTYGDSESVERAAKLRRDDFTMMIL